MFSLRNFLLVLAVVGAVVGVLVSYLIQWKWSTPGVVNKPLPKYDYVVVGAGTAGCVVARRLWEKTNASVLLIEAGGPPSWMGSIPLLAPTLQQTSSDWAYKTTPQKFSQKGLLNAQSAWPRGKVVGGSSAINYLLHTWGAKSDFDRLWSSEDEKWKFESLHPYFKKSENYVRAAGIHVSETRGKNGPLNVSEFGEETSPLVKAFMDGVQQLGIETGDLNGELDNGAMLSQSNIWRGWRVSAFDAYLKPIISSSNIHLLTDTLALQVVLNDRRRAVAVVAVNTLTREVFHIEANKEVILSAGVIGSPLILMWSGIGPQEALEKHNISVIFDLPGVGQNLMDHMNVPLYFHLESPISKTTSKVRSLGSVWKYLTNGTGPLSHGGVEAIVRLPGGGKNDSNMVFLFFNLGSVNEKIFTAISNFDKDYFADTFPGTKNDSKEGFIILASCSQPISRGYVSLSSANPFDPPIIEPNYLKQSEDLKCLKKAIKMAAKLGSTKPLRELGARLHLPGYESCSEHEQSLDDRRYLECWIRTSAITAYHPVGTCAMGHKAMSVVDSTLRVHGTDNLRVVDGSIFPHHISGNPNAVVTMVAERAVDFII